MLIKAIKEIVSIPAIILLSADVISQITNHTDHEAGDPRKYAVIFFKNGKHDHVSNIADIADIAVSDCENHRGKYSNVAIMGGTTQSTSPKKWNNRALFRNVIGLHRLAVNC